MFRRKSILIKSIAPVLSVVLLATNCVFAHSAEVNFWKERQRAAKNQNVQLAMNLPLPAPSFPNVRHGESVLGRISIGNPGRNPFPVKNWIPAFAGMTALPLQYGTIRKVLKSQSSNSKSQLIIHIQDVHMNREAQANIGKTVQALMADGKVGLIALEGASQPIDLAAFKEFPNQDTIHKVADYLLSENKISGPIHAVLMEGSKIENGSRRN